jgi:glucose/arabinose dehydrogenase
MRCISLFAFLAAYCVANPQTLTNNQLYYTLHVQGLTSPTSFEFLSPSIMIVVEKVTGKAKVITNGTYTGDAIDLPVASDGEMGLLGIAKDPNFAANNFVYLFYSNAASDGGAWIDDRLVRYTWNGTNLVSPVPLWVMGPTVEFPNMNLFHHGGYIRIGPDNKIYLQRGDMLRYGCFEMNNNINLIGVAGCIYRLNLDGSAPSDNPFFSNPNPNIKKIWLYGFRNGFGMTWDRTTDDLWFTENGPEVYDEINIARPGMNSGWRLIMGPDSRDATYVQNNHTPSDAGDLLYLPGATYHDPVFSYLAPLGVTGFEFFSSTRFLETPSVFDNLVMGVTNTAKIYCIPVNAARDGVVATGGLADLVADNGAEADLWSIGTSWGAVTDAKIGPDGYMYLCSWNGGKILKVRPKADAVFPSDVERIRGSIFSGNLTTSLQYPDDDRLQIRPGVVLVSSQAPVVLECAGTSPFPSPSGLDFVIEASASSAAIDLDIEVFNYSTGQFAHAGHVDLTTTDTKYTIAVPGTPGNFVEDGSNEMKARISMRAGGPVLLYPWTGRIDMVHWTSDIP